MVIPPTLLDSQVQMLRLLLRAKGQRPLAPLVVDLLELCRRVDLVVGRFLRP